MSRVLVIDDSATIRGQVCQALAGFDLVEAVDGLEGAEILETQSDIALAFCDINMPRMTGLEMLERVHEKTANRDVHIVMLTTESQPGAIKTARQLGAKGWIVKPFNPGQLLAVARKLTGHVE